MLQSQFIDRKSNLLCFVAYDGVHKKKILQFKNANSLMTPSLIILKYYSTYHRHRHVGLQCLDTNIIQVGCVLVVAGV